MEFQTWTRKANAVKAVQTVLADLEAELLDDAYITGVDAEDVSNGLQSAAYEGRVFCEADPKTTVALQSALGTKAKVFATYEKPEVKLETKPLKLETKKKPERKSLAGERRLIAKEGINPYRHGSASHLAWEWLREHPGATYNECKAAGIRMRAISHGIKEGWIEVEV